VACEQARKLTLFELKDNCRPEAERTAAGRYREPTLLGLMVGDELRRPRFHSSLSMTAPLPPMAGALLAPFCGLAQAVANGCPMVSVLSTAREHRG
jgi:hypothetical protein